MEDIKTFTKRIHKWAGNLEQNDSFVAIPEAMDIEAPEVVEQIREVQDLIDELNNKIQDLYIDTEM